jgi:hypothetical protein
MATEEGPVIVQLWGDHTVVVSESFDQDTAAKLSAAVRDTGHKAQALNVSDELGMRLYDLPAFRNYQQRFREEILDSISPALATK